MIYCPWIVFAATRLQIADCRLQQQAVLWNVSIVMTFVKLVSTRLQPNSFLRSDRDGTLLVEIESLSVCLLGLLSKISIVTRVTERWDF